MPRKPRLRTSQVFVPGKLPEYTYNPRNEFNLELQLEDYVEEAGKILTLAGPTKTGKTVLLQKVLTEPVWVDGQGLTSTTDLWSRVVDELDEFLGEELTKDVTESGGVSGGLNVGIANLQGGAQGSTTNGTRLVTNRTPVTVARDALVESGRPLVIDDFHFIERNVQREIVRALKPLVLKGVPIVFVSISHRVREVVLAEPDMTGRVDTLSIEFWTVPDLLVIAEKGFAELNLVDPNHLAEELAKQSFGSPHLMQQFCRELCKENGIRERPDDPFELQAPDSWDDFFARQIEESSENWAMRLLRGPLERGSLRTKYAIKGGGELDGYGLILLAVARSGSKLEISSDEIRTLIQSLVENEAPANAQITSFLKRLSKIAELRIGEAAPSEDELDAESGVYTDSQPVVDFVDEGPLSSLHIADPFFAFYMRWGFEKKLFEMLGAE